jgi:NCAIR mutase (PurE)-related protein
MFKAAFVLMAPDGDPNQHRATIKTSKLELNVAVVEMMNFEQAAKVCQDLVQKQGVQSFVFCPGFTHQAIAKIANAVGEKVPINVARGDLPSTMITGEILAKEGWFPEGH